MWIQINDEQWRIIIVKSIPDNNTTLMTKEVNEKKGIA